MQQFLIVVAFLVCFGFEALAFPGGAVLSVCTDGTPGGAGSTTHGNLGNGNGGFSLEFSPSLPSPSTYTPETQYTITLGGGNFVGFAISPLTQETGALAPGANSRQLGACTDFSDDAGLTHVSSASKTSATGTWTAPEAGTASMRWTVLNQFFGTWFIETVTLTAAASPTPAPVPTSAPTPTLAPEPEPKPEPEPESPEANAPSTAPTEAPEPEPEPEPSMSSTTVDPETLTSDSNLPRTAWLLVVTLCARLLW